MSGARSYGFSQCGVFRWMNREGEGEMVWGGNGEKMVGRLGIGRGKGKGREEWGGGGGKGEGVGMI